MKRTLGVLLAFATIATAFSAAPVAAKKPVKITFFAHGVTPIGEVDQAINATSIADGQLVFLPMSEEKPAGPDKSIGIANALVTPNTNCAGNPLWPVWEGALTGRVVGDMKFTFHSVSTPTKVNIRVWPDIMTLSCNETYVEPVAAKVVDLAGGHEEVTVKLGKVNFPVSTRLIIQVTPFLVTEGGAPQATRLFYDSESFDTRLEFSCIPASGSSCTG